MLGKDSLEGAIYPAYLEYLDKHHPGAPLPGLFADEELFDNADEALDKMGDATFFAPMNAGTEAASDDAWGELATTGLWDRVTFDEARRSADPKRRRDLLDALLRTHFKAFRSSASSFKDLDDGLSGSRVPTTNGARIHDPPPNPRSMLRELRRRRHTAACPCRATQRRSGRGDR